MLPSEVKVLINECAKMNVRLVQKLKPYNLDFLMWTSPISCRNSDSTWLWHPSFLRKNNFIKIGVFIYIFFRYFFIGIKRFFLYRGFFYHYEETNSPVLLVIPEEITSSDNILSTPYLIENKEYPIGEFIFSQTKPIGQRCSNLSHYQKVFISWLIFKVLILDVMNMIYRRQLSFSYWVSVALLSRWIVSQGWYFDWCFYQQIDGLISSDVKKYKALLALHEMYFYSRSLWHIAKKRQLTGITAQHAVIVPERLTWFPESIEIEHGCPEPDIFFIYGKDSEELFRPHYPSTRFVYGCSLRFNKWKKTPLLKRKTSDQYILILAGAMYFDVEILLQAVRTLLRSKSDSSPTIKIRLHSHGHIRLVDKLWIGLAKRLSRVELSSETLEKDFENAALVIGCNSVGLLEAVLLGIPVLSVNSHKYICPALIEPGQVWESASNHITWQRVQEQITKNPSLQHVSTCRDRLGLDQPDLSTELILKECGL